MVRKTPELAVQAVYKGQEPRADGMEERVPAGLYRNTSTAARVKKERIALEREPVAIKEEKDKRKSAKVTPEFTGAVRKQDIAEGELG